MLLKNYTKEIFRPECNPSFQSVHCIARLDEDIREVLPYLNTVLGGTHYSADPPSLTLVRDLLLLAMALQVLFFDMRLLGLGRLWSSGKTA
jgi:hypothetical protein